MNHWRSVLLCVGLSCLVSAQESPGLAVRAELMAPLQNLRDANGGKPGAGFALAATFPLEDGWAWRAELGHAFFFKGATAGAPGVTTAVDVSHLSAEGVYQLRELVGPYVFAGLGAYSWYVKQTDAGLALASNRRVAHLGVSLGFGYRLTPHLDVELRGMAGKVDPDFTAGWAGVSAAWRF